MSDLTAAIAKLRVFDTARKKALATAKAAQNAQVLLSAAEPLLTTIDAATAQLTTLLAGGAVSTPVVVPPVVVPPVVPVTVPVVVPVVPVVTPGIDARIAPDPATGPPNGVNWQEPIMILSGMADGDGVIRPKGHFRSLNPNVPALLLNCGDRRVDLSQCFIAHAGHGIKGGDATNLKATDVSFYGLNTGVDNLTRMPAIQVSKGTNVDLQYITTESGGGIFVEEWFGNHTPSQTVKIRNVKSRNVIGGDGGWRGGASGPKDGREYRHMVQIKDVHTNNMVFEWLESYNEANKSRIEDTFNFFNSGGLNAGNPALLQNFFFKGSYPFPANTKRFTGAAVSGDGDGNPLLASSFIRVNRGWAVSNGNAAYNISGGHDVLYENLKMVTAGLLPDGSPMQCSYTGAGISDYYGTGLGNNLYIRNLVAGFMRSQDVLRRCDLTDEGRPVHPGITNVTPLPGPITLAMEEACFTEWVALLNANNQTCGSRYKA